MMRSPDGTAFDIHGPVDAPVVVLVHGLGLTRAVWDLTQPALVQRYRVVSYDILGHGQTPSVAAPTLSHLTRQLADLLDYLRLPRATIVGFSLGGMIARHFAQTHPDRATALGILHSPHTRTAEAQAAIAARVVQARSSGPAATVEAALVRWFTDDFRAANPRVMDLVRSWVLGNNPATYPDYYAILVEGVAGVVAPQPPLTLPTLVITGDQDYGNGPEMTQAIAADIPGAQTLILPGLRHMALMEDPAAINTPLRAFLDALPRP
jgi:pimeloyl-ACP methyl ester carboxylesterase